VEVLAERRTQGKEDLGFRKKDLGFGIQELRVGDPKS
jgi:hypothetical protein